MEGDLQPLYLLLTDCYIYLLRKGRCLKTSVRKWSTTVASHSHTDKGVSIQLPTRLNLLIQEVESPIFLIK